MDRASEDLDMSNPARLDGRPGVSHRASDPFHAQHTAKVPAEGETVGPDTGVEINEEVAGAEESLHPSVDLGQKTEVDLEEGPGGDPQRQAG